LTRDIIAEELTGSSCFVRIWQIMADKAEHNRSRQALIREAEERDIPRILDLYEQLTIATSKIELEEKTTEDGYRQILSQIGSAAGHQLLVLEYEGEVVGSMVLLIVPNLSHGGHPWAIIENLIIDSRYRRLKFGEMLIEYAIEKAKDTGCYNVELSSTRSSRNAHRFYRSIGFEATAYGFRLYF
jgi:ribosomal protein S18 acetylase RimI-like enzyme